MRTAAVALLVGCIASQTVDAQRRTTPARQPARQSAPVAPKTEPAMVACPQVLGTGVKTMRTFCDVLTGTDPAGGIIITLPPHSGPVTLLFDLHNRHLYSEDQIKANRGFHRYTATVGVLALDNTLLSRAVVQNEFRTAADLFDRVTGGAGPGGLKNVAPTGVEPIVIEIPAEEQKVSILGERRSVLRVEGAPETFNASGSPIAVISNVMVQYRPAPPPRQPARRR